MAFQGFDEDALDFYDDLEMDNTKAFWEAHRDVYTTAVAEPMAALTEELAAEFGQAKIFRPYRDVRFAKDKTPYKTHAGAVVQHGRELERIVTTLTKTGWEISGSRLKTAPRGWDPGHPRIDLLRHKSITIGKDYGFGADVIGTPALVDRIRTDWRAATPLVAWLERHGG